MRYVVGYSRHGSTHTKGKIGGSRQVREQLVVASIRKLTRNRIRASPQFNGFIEFRPSARIVQLMAARWLPNGSLAGRFRNFKQLVDRVVSRFNRNVSDFVMRDAARIGAACIVWSV